MIETVSGIVTIILGIAVAVAGSKYLAMKEKLANIAKLLDTVSLAVADDKVTPEEVQAIIAAAKKIVS